MISRAEAFRTWLKIGLLSFGGPAGQIALMHKILVEEKNWISETRFLHALNYCMLLPGPEATQLATYVGWLLHKTWGGLVAGLLFILPGIALMMGLSAIYAQYHAVPFVDAVFFGLKSAVLVLVVEAVIRIGKKSLHNNVLKALAVASFIGIFFLGVPFPLIILVAGVIGFAGSKYAPKIFTVKPHKEAKDTAEKSIVDKMEAAGLLEHTKPDKLRAFKTLAVWLLLWFAPTAYCLAFLGEWDVFSLIGIFFSKMAVVTFGGAYAVLSYVAQQAVEQYHWLTAGDMLNGLGLAETTPGPLILVLQYVGYLAAFARGGHLAGIAGAALAVWVTFVPCFLWIFLGAPYVELIRANKSLSAALSAITGAVTGVVMNLAVWFALHVLFQKVDQSDFHGITFYSVAKPDGFAALLALFAAKFTFDLKWSIPKVLGFSALAGIVLKLVVPALNSL